MQPIFCPMRIRCSWYIACHLSFDFRVGLGRGTLYFFHFTSVCGCVCVCVCVRGGGGGADVFISLVCKLGCKLNGRMHYK